MRDKYIEECKVVRQNCMYTAETHHQMAQSAKRQAFWFQVVPAACAAVSSTLIAVGVLDIFLLPFTVLAATASAVASVLNPNRVYEEHLSAARSFTSLKHDARFLCEAASSHMSDDAFAIAVENLHQRYNDLLKSSPPTDDEAFEKARERIKNDRHEPDRNPDGTIK